MSGDLQSPGEAIVTQLSVVNKHTCTFRMLHALDASARVEHTNAIERANLFRKDWAVMELCDEYLFPDGLVVRIRRSHRRGRGSIPRTGDQTSFIIVKPVSVTKIAFVYFQFIKQ